MNEQFNDMTYTKKRKSHRCFFSYNYFSYHIFSIRIKKRYVDRKHAQAADSFYKHQYLFIMTSLTFNSQKNCDFRGSEVQQLKSKILALESETDILNRIISINDQTLEEINELVITHLETLRNMNNHYISASQITKGYTKEAEDSYHNSYEENASIISKVNQAISNHCDSFRGTLHSALIDRNDDVNTLKKSLKMSKKYRTNTQSKQQVDCDTSIEEYTSSKAIFEVPIEVQLLKEVTDKYIQVDMANEHKHYIYEVPLQIHQIFQIPVELNQIYQIPVELNHEQHEENNRIFQIPVEINEVFEVFDEKEIQGENIIQQIPIINSKQNQDKQNDQLYQMIKQLRDQIARLREENQMLQYQQKHKFYEIPVEVKVFGDIQLLNDPKSLEHLPLQIQIQSKQQLEAANFGSQKQTSFKHVQSKIQTQTRTDLENMISPYSQHNNAPVKTSIMMSKPIKYQPLNSHNQQHESQTLKDIKQLNLYVDKHVDYKIQANSAEELQMRDEFDDAPFQMEFYGDHFEIQMEVRVQNQSVEQQSQTDFFEIPKTIERIVKIPFIKTVQVPIQVQIIKERIVKIPQLKIIQIPVQQIISNIIQIPVQINLEKEQMNQCAEKQDYPIVLKSHNKQPIIAQKIQTVQTKTIIRQVPIEVIVQKIIQLPPKVIVRQVPIQVIVQKIIQLPPIVIMKQIPIEVIVQKEVIVIIEKQVQKIVEVPIQIFVQKKIPMVREVPVEVYIQNTKQIKVVEIREVPIEVIVEKEVIRQVEKIVTIIQTKIKEVPIEVIVEKIVYVPQIKEVPVEVIVEKIVYVPQIRQIPIEVQVQKYIEIVVQKFVQVPIFIQIPIQMILQRQIIIQKKIPILKQIPTQVVIERQIQRIVEIPVHLIRQVPVQVIVQIQRIKIIKQIVQVPVIMMIDQKSNNQLSPIQAKNNQISSLGYYSADRIKEQQPSIDYIANEEHSGDIGRLRLQSNQPLLQNQEYKSSALDMHIDILPQIQIRQIPVELIMVDEVPVIKSVPKIYQLPTEVVLVEEIEKIVYVQKIVEVIVQKIVELDRIVEVPIEVIIQKPIYIERQKIVEIPIEVEVEKEIIVYRNRIIEVPIQVILQDQQIIAQPQQINVLQSRTFSYDKQHNLIHQIKEAKQSQQLLNIQQQNQSENMQRISSFHLINEKTGMTQRYYEFPLNLAFLEENKDIIVDISHMMDNQNQYGQIIIEFPSDRISVVSIDASVQASQDVQQIQSASIRLNSRNIQKISIQCADTGVQTVMVQDKLRIVEIPIQLQLQEQILQKELQVKYRIHMDDLRDKYQSQINELNKNIIALQSIIIENNQEKQLLHQKIEQNALDKQTLLNKYQEAIQQVKQLKQLSSSKSHNYSNKIYEVPIQIKSLNQIYQLPIEIILQKQGVDIQIQTEDIQLEYIDLIQLPIQVQRDEYVTKEAYFEDLQAQFQQEELIELQNQMKESKVQNIHLEKIPAQEVLKAQSISEQIQTDITLNQYEDIVILRNTIDNPYETNLLQIHLVNQIQGENIIQQVTFSNHTIKQHKQYSSQTDSIPVTVQNYVYELPVEILQVPQTQEASIQTQEIQMSSSSNKSSSSDEEYDEQMLVQTQRNSNIYSKQNKTETNFHKRKPYSDYFRSRIFEIPIQLNVKNDHNNIEIQTFDKKLESIEVQTQVSQRELDGLSQIWQSRQKQAILSRLTLVPAFEAVALILQQPNTPKKLTENKIVRLGSELSNPGAYQNFSHAQSLTPNQLDGSISYQKFPQPTININNISLIKKSSLHSQYNKFLGSLDMRQDLLNHDSAIASVRLNNKRLMGFDKQQSSSEQEDIHNLSREMIIEQNETINSRDINRIQTPNLQPHDLNFSDYATLKQKFYEPEEYKKNYQEMYQHSQNQIEGLKLKIGHKIQEVNQLKIQIDQQTCRYQEQIRKMKEQIVKIQKESIDQYNIAENYRIKVEELHEEKVKLQEKQQILVERWERLKDQSEKLQNSTNKEIERLRQIIAEKMSQIKDLKSDQYHQKEVYQLQLVQFRQIIHQKTETIDTLQQQLQRRSDRIDQLLMLIEEMRKNISNHASESDTAAIYQQQFVRVKQGFEQQKNELNYQLFQLKQQNQQLRNKLNEEVKKSQELQQHITYLQNQLDEAKHDYSSLHHLKSELENNYMEGVKNLNCQLEQMKQIVREKEEFIHRIHPTLQNMAPNMTKSSHQQSPVRVQYLSKQPSQLTHDSSKGLEAYTKKLQGLIKKYERIIIENQNTMQDQQDKVYEYLKDALQKQQQAQSLYLKLVDYENTINKVLVEKVTLQVENKRLTKQMELSQKKLSVLGNRLIEVARQRAEYDSDDDVYYQ